MPQDDFAHIDLGHWRERFRVNVSCRDCDGLPRVPDAGKYMIYNGQEVQIMHNGLLVLKDGYNGPGQSLIMEFLRGVHEPQEEKVFSEVLPYMPAGAVMVELGCWWSYYSLWFNKVVPGARNYCIEPDAKNLEVGIKNFLINGAEAVFIQAGVTNSPETISHESLKFKGDNILLPLDGQTHHSSQFNDYEHIRRAIPAITIDSFMAEQGLEYIDMLHVDIQLAEHHLLRASPKSFSEKRVGYVFLSTHAYPGHWYTADFDKYHYECLQMLRDTYGYHIVAEHSVSDSFSGDGMIVAKIPGHQGPDHVKVSKLSATDFAGLYGPR